jgi:hypothetical protein
MRPLLICAMSAGFVLAATCITSAHAECYGDAASMYGCGATTSASKPARRSGNLEHFGDASAPVLPDVASSQAGADDVITSQERRRMLRSIVLGSGRRSWSERSFMQAVNSSGRPLRRSGSVNGGGGR